MTRNELLQKLFNQIGEIQFDLVMNPLLLDDTPEMHSLEIKAVYAKLEEARELMRLVK
jgi:hypothetical protein